MEARIGRQTPTTSVVLPYTNTAGDQAIELYKQTGREPLEWQVLMVYDIMARNADDLWTHSRFGFAIPRQNGKNEIVSIRELWGIQHGERILHTAHRTATSRSAWERLKRFLDDAGIDHKDSGALGQERIRIKATGGEVSFRTRSNAGGLGESYDLLIIDEAQEYTEAQESALKYTIAASMNPQNLFCGTPPTMISSGTVFMNMRNQILTTGLEDTGWAEWSVDSMKDPSDVEAWYATNPSLGLRLTERTIKREIGPDQLDFNIQRLGYWVRYNLKSEISKVEWDELKSEKVPALRSKIFAGIKYSKTSTVALSIAVRAFDGRIFIESIDCRPVRAGVEWIVSFLAKLDLKTVVVDGDSGKQLLTEAMKDAGLHQPLKTSTQDVIAACASFEQRMATKELTHMGQPSLMQSATNCEKRSIGSNGGFGYKSINDSVDVALLDSAILAQWICGQKTKKTPKRQRTSC